MQRWKMCDMALSPGYIIRLWSVALLTIIGMPPWPGMSRSKVLRQQPLGTMGYSEITIITFFFLCVDAVSPVPLVPFLCAVRGVRRVCFRLQ